MVIGRKHKNWHQLRECFKLSIEGSSEYPQMFAEMEKCTEASLEDRKKYISEFLTHY